MKAVQELVAYFDRRGMLSRRHVRRLLDQGMLAADAPATMVDLSDTIGASYYFRVTGETDGTIWGTDIYTGDSALKPGQTAVIKITVEAPLSAYQGSLRNGIASHDFARFGSAYRLSAI
jgi:hypothetical protein